MLNCKITFLFAFTAWLFLTGSQCTFVASSSNHQNPTNDENNTGLIVIIGDDPPKKDPAQGVRYIAGLLSGVTGPNGEFRYQQGIPIRFYIGDIQLGEAVEGKPLLTLHDLVQGNSTGSTAVVNMARLLHSLDSIPGDNRITIPPAVTTAAVTTNKVLYPAIQLLNFTDDTEFVNSASQLVATLTASYPFTAVLVDK